MNTSSTGPLLSLAPIIIVGILFGLAMDYQVFLVSRMHEAHAHGTPAREAIVVGFRQAAPVVVAAATIMFAVFAGFVPDGDPDDQIDRLRAGHGHHLRRHHRPDDRRAGGACAARRGRVGVASVAGLVAGHRRRGLGVAAHP